MDWQRTSKRKKKLTVEWEELLDEIGFVWSAIDERWENRFVELTKYKEQKGNCNVPRGHSDLGNWVHSQRTLYKDNNISEEPTKRVDKHSTSWVIDEEHGNRRQSVLEWRERYEVLKKYKTTHGHCDRKLGYRPAEE